MEPIGHSRHRQAPRSASRHRARILRLGHMTEVPTCGSREIRDAFPVSQHLRVQMVDATSSFNASNGDTQLRVLRGRSLSSRSIAVSSR